MTPQQIETQFLDKIHSALETNDPSTLHSIAASYEIFVRATEHSLHVERFRSEVTTSAPPATETEAV